MPTPSHPRSARADTPRSFRVNVLLCLLYGIGGFITLVTLTRSAQARPIGFREAVALARKQSPTLAMRRAQLGAARGLLTSARGNAWPHLGLTWTAARSNDPLTVLGYRLSQGRASFADLGLGDYSGQGAIEARPPALNSPPYVDDFDTGIVLDIPLFTSGRHRAEIRGAEAGVSARHARLLRAREEVTYRVFLLYDRVITASHLLQAAEKTRVAAGADLRIARERFAKGLVIRSDVLTAEAHRSAVQTAVEEARADWENALTAFHLALGLPPASPVTPRGLVTVSEPRGPPRLLIARALTRNPALKALQSMVQARQADLRLARSADGPQLGLMLRHDWNTRTPGFRAPSNTILLQLSWDLFSAGTVSGRITAARERRLAAHARLEKARRDLTLAVIRAIRQIRVLKQALRSSAAGTREARTSAHLIGLRYAHGLSTLDALLNAQARLAHARGEFILSEYRLALAHAGLALVLNHLAAREAHADHPLMPHGN